MKKQVFEDSGSKPSTKQSLGSKMQSTPISTENESIWNFSKTQSKSQRDSKPGVSKMEDQLQHSGPKLKDSAADSLSETKEIFQLVQIKNMKEDSERQLNTSARDSDQSKKSRRQIEILNNQLLHLQTLIYKKNEIIGRIQQEKNCSNLDDYFEAVRLFNFVIAHCKSKDFYYSGADRAGRVDADALVTDIEGLMRKLKDTFQSLNRSVNLGLSREKLSDREPASGRNGDMRGHKDTPAVKDLGAYLDQPPRKMLKQNFTFEVPEPSIGILGSSQDKRGICEGIKNTFEKEVDRPLLETPKSSKNQTQQKVIYICSLEQNLSSDKKSYKIERDQNKDKIVLVEDEDKPEMLRKKEFYNRVFYKQSRNTAERLSESNIIGSQFEWTCDKQSKIPRTSELEQSDANDEDPKDSACRQAGLKNSTLMQIESRRFIDNIKGLQTGQDQAERRRLLSKEEYERTDTAKDSRKNEDQTEGGFRLKITKGPPMGNFSFNFNQPQPLRESKTIDESFVNIAKTTQNSKNNVFKENSNGFQSSLIPKGGPFDKKSLSQNSFKEGPHHKPITESELLYKSENLPIRSTGGSCARRALNLDIQQMELYPKFAAQRQRVELHLQSTFTYQRKQISSLLKVDAPSIIWYRPKLPRTRNSGSEFVFKPSLSTILNTSQSICSRPESNLRRRRPESIKNLKRARMVRKSKKMKRKSKQCKWAREGAKRGHRPSKSFNGCLLESESSLYSKYMRILKKSKQPVRAKPNYKRKLQQLKDKMKPKTTRSFLRPLKYSSRAINRGLRKLKTYKKSLLLGEFERGDTRNRSFVSRRPQEETRFYSKFENNLSNNENFLLN